MSNVVKCDGPDCTVTRDPNITERRMCEPGWTHATQEDGGSYDFHDTDCLVKWGGGFTTSVDLAELRLAWDNPPPVSGAGQPINMLVSLEWTTLADALNRLLGT